MSTTPIACAHVCTPQRKPQYWFSSGAADFLNGDRRFFVVEANDLPPENWVGNIAPGIRCQDDIAEYTPSPDEGDFYSYVADETPHAGATRHGHTRPECTGLWRVTLHKYANCRLWKLKPGL